MYNESMSLSSPNFDRVAGFPAGADQGLYPISVVTELTGISVHTLRGYDRAGLLEPARTEGGSRRYSDNDLAVLRRITALTDERINLAGIRRIIALEVELAALRAELAHLRACDGGDPPGAG